MVSVDVESYGGGEVKPASLTPIEEAQRIIDTHKLTLYAVPHCVRVMALLLDRIRELEVKLQTQR
jgi:hypothetical protein